MYLSQWKKYNHDVPERWYIPVHLGYTVTITLNTMINKMNSSWFHYKKIQTISAIFHWKCAWCLNINIVRFWQSWVSHTTVSVTADMTLTAEAVDYLSGREVIATRTHGAADISLMIVVNHAVICSLRSCFIAWYSITRLCRKLGRYSLSNCNKKEPQEYEILWSSIISTRIGWPRDLEIIKGNWETWKIFLGGSKVFGWQFEIASRILTKRQ